MQHMFIVCLFVDSLTRMI